MTTVLREGEPSRQKRTLSVQTYAKTAGLLALLSLVAGGFGEAYVPSKIIVSNDAIATVENLRASDVMFRLSFAGYLVEACCDLTLALIFYVLLKPVNKYVSLLAAFFGIMGTATFAAAELFYFAPTLLLKGSAYLKSFSLDQLNTLVLLSLKLFGLGAAIFAVFYGVGWVLRGYLMYQSGYFPKFLGILMTVAGLAFIASNFVRVFAPRYPSGWLMFLMMPGLLLLTVWLLVKGVDLPKWKEKTVGSGV
jgi:hypothetical protein